MENRNPESDERQRIETALKEFQEAYRQMLDAIPDCYIEYDLAGNVTFANKASLDWSSRSKAEIIGMSYKKLLDEKTLKQIKRVYSKVYATKVPRKGFIHDMVRKDGERRIIECSISLKETNGQATGFREIWHDITDRKRTEEELANHRSRLEAIFGSVREGIIAVDTDSKVIDANKAIENVCGVRSEDITGLPFAKTRPLCSMACQNILQETLEKQATIREYQIECHRHDKPQQVVVVTSSPLIDSQSKFKGAVLVIRDVTKLRSLEKELRGRYQFQQIVGKSKKMRDIYDFLENLANLETTVLITGESGTGKELVARALHYGGERAFKPFVTVNCSALAENLLESELFGHVKGAFTGATRDRLGRFQTANEGTILLDEIGDISPLIQMKLMRVLQEKEFERVGESNPQKVDVRVIACTNKDLKEKVMKGEFREDLYYRLKVVEITLPPLRDRLEDVPLLTTHFCRSFNEKFKKNIKGISHEALEKFMNYPWPGNVRELEHALEHAFVLCNGREIKTEHLPPEIRGYKGTENGTARAINGNKPKQDQEIIDVLNKTDWNKAKAARLLGINRRTIYRKISKLQMTEPH